MVDDDLQVVSAVLQVVGDVECPHGAAHQFFGVLVAVERHGGIGAYAFELQEVAAAGAPGGLEGLLIECLAVQVAMA